VLILAFDTATDVAEAALVRDGELLAERSGDARGLLRLVDELVAEANGRPGDIDALVTGTGPGSFTSTRIGLAVARGLGLALGIPAAGVSTLDALAAGAPGALPVIDARRREVFAPGPRALAPTGLDLESGQLCVGSGALRYRGELETLGAVVPPDDDPRHRPRAVHHAGLATGFAPADRLEPVYVRAPDAVPSA
jgi:tRNA threonylcarbamoyladenosine biosynthesis protein TsaB